MSLDLHSLVGNPGNLTVHDFLELTVWITFFEDSSLSRMSQSYGGPKPEHVLRKAQDSLDIGKPKSAIKALNQLFSRRPRSFTPSHEKCMEMLVRLGVDLGQSISQALYNYRMGSMSGNFLSLQTILIKYRDLAEAKAADAQLRASTGESTEMLDDDDDSPELFALMAAGGENIQARLDHQATSPAIRYLNETYRAILETLRNVDKLHELYHLTARRAFDFCVQHKRHAEFRRFGENLRHHFAALRYRAADRLPGIDISQPEIQQLYLATRLHQLDAAVKLEAWQEASVASLSHLSLSLLSHID